MAPLALTKPAACIAPPIAASSWTQIFQSIGTESAAVSPKTGELYVSTEENGLYYSANPKAAKPVFSQTTYPFRQPERIFFNPFNPDEVWVTSFGYGLMVGNTAVAPVPGAITGSVFDDLNHDGKQEAGEAGLAGWVIQLNTGAKATTDANGHYVFGNLAGGTYQVSEIVKSGWTRTAPKTSPTPITVTPGKTSAGPTFGDAQLK